MLDVDVLLQRKQVKELRNNVGSITMNKIPFNDDNTNKGVEGWYSFYKDKLIFYIKPTNSKEDWWSDIVAIPVYDILANCKIHAGFNGYAHWMNDFIIKKANVQAIRSEDIYIFGYSMGGGITQILGEFNNNYTPVSIDGNRTTTKLTNKKSVLYYNRGSLVHNLVFWFKKIENRICLNKKWQPFWKSHNNYDIDKIIEGVI